MIRGIGPRASPAPVPSGHWHAACAPKPMTTAEDQTPPTPRVPWIEHAVAERHGPMRHRRTVPARVKYAAETMMHIPVHVFESAAEGPEHAVYAFVQPGNAPQLERLVTVPRSEAVPSPDRAVLQAISREIGADRP